MYTIDAKEFLTGEIQVVLTDGGVVVRNLAEQTDAQLVIASYTDNQLKGVFCGAVGNGAYTLSEDSDAVTFEIADGTIVRAFLREKDTLVPLCTGDEKVTKYRCGFFVFNG